MGKNWKAKKKNQILYVYACKQHQNNKIIKKLSEQKKLVYWLWV